MCQCASRWRLGLDPRWPGCRGSACSAGSLIGHQVARLLNSVSCIFSIWFSSFSPSAHSSPRCTDLGTEPGTGAQAPGAALGSLEMLKVTRPSVPAAPAWWVSRPCGSPLRPRLATALQPEGCAYTRPTPVLVPSQRPCLPLQISPPGWRTDSNI